MKKLFNPSCLLLLALLSACNPFRDTIEGNGVAGSETRSIDNATQIKVQGGIDVYVSSGAPSVRVEADENLLPYITTEMDDNWLEVDTRSGVNLDSKRPIKVFVTTPTLNRVMVAGSGDVVVPEQLENSGKVKVNIAGSGDVTMAVNAPSVDADIAGSGSIKLSGEAREVEVSIAGSGNFDSRELKSENAKVNIAGSGDAFVFADVSLKARVAGSGNVHYKGRASVEQNVLGSGSISKIN